MKLPLLPDVKPSMNPYRADSMTDLHQIMCEDMLYGEKWEYDWITNTDVIKENVFAQADTMNWECDISRFWIPPSRWTMMVRQYLNPQEVEKWVHLIQKRTIQKQRNANRMVLRTQTVAARYAGNATTRSLGSCMLSISASLQPAPTILLHSRTGYQGYLTPLDWSVAWHCGRLVASALSMELTEFRFQWFAETIQYHRFRTIAFALGDEAERKRFKATVAQHKEDGVLPEYPALHRNWEQYQKWLRADKEGLTYNELSNYRSSQRPRKRFHSQVRGYEYASQFADPGHKAFPVLKPLDVKDLTLSGIGLE